MLLRPGNLTAALEILKDSAVFQPSYFIIFQGVMLKCAGAKFYQTGDESV